MLCICENLCVDLVNIKASAKFGLIPSIRSEDTARNEILTIIKGHNSVVNMQKLPRNNPNLDLN